MQLKSYVQGKWVAGAGEGAALRDATTGAVVARASTDGIDFKGALDYGRRIGGPTLRALTFHERAALIKAPTPGIVSKACAEALDCRLASICSSMSVNRASIAYR